MTDEQVREYLQARGRVTPPLDLVPSVMDALADTSPQRHNWFAPFVPGIAVAGIAAAVLVAALIVGQRPVGNPDVSHHSTPSPTSVPSADATTSASPTDVPAPASLLAAGDRVEIDAVDASGPWGTISITRGADVGGYREIAAVDLPPSGDATAMYFQNDPESFYLELEILYTADRDPEPRLFGGDDWRLVTDGLEIEPIEIMGGNAGLPTHDGFPGPAIELVGNPVGGDLRFAVPRDLADSTLNLEYRPDGAESPAWSLLVREPGSAPDPVPSVVPPTLPAYVDKEGLAFAVIDSAEADRLFSDPDTCSNPEAGYTVTYPDGWYTNTAVDDVPPCTWFSPVFFEVDDPGQVPEEIAFAIRFDRAEGMVGMSGQELDIPQVDPIDNRPVRRSEQVGVGGGFVELGTFSYSYRVGLDGRFPDEDGPASTLYAAVAWDLDDDPAAYTLNKAVLDRVIASMEFDD